MYRIIRYFQKKKKRGLRITNEQETNPIRELIAQNLDKYVDMGPGYHAGDGGIYYPEGVIESPRLKKLMNALEEFIRRFDSPDQIKDQDYTEFIEGLNNVLITDR